jgi:hypothetical protein
LFSPTWFSGVTAFVGVSGGLDIPAKAQQSSAH